MNTTTNEPFDGYVSSSIGFYSSGYLHGEALAWARNVMSNGGRIEVQGPSSRGGSPKLFGGCPRPTASAYAYFGIVYLHDDPETE